MAWYFGLVNVPGFEDKHILVDCGHTQIQRVRNLTFLTKMS